VLTGEKGDAPGGARLLAVVVQELHPLLCQPINVGRVVAHDPVAVATEVRDADIVAEDDQDIRLVGLCHALTPVFDHCSVGSARARNQQRVRSDSTATPPANDQSLD
jgi:hypothetical protein